jgi:hypothetical protein
MRNLYVFIIFCFLYSTSQAQCPTGYTSHTLDWDYADFLQSNGDYNGYVTLAQAQSQRFAFGPHKLTITHNYSAATTLGENTDNTGEAGSYGSGADVNFSGNGTITLTFDVEVQNLKFSLYDIDRSQRVKFDATDAAATALPVTLARLGGTNSVLTIANNNSTTAQVTASNTSVDDDEVYGTVNVDVPGAVKSITITVSNTGQSAGFYLSDITACISGTYTQNYYNISKPFTNQPAYVLAVRNDSIYYVNVADGKSKFLFADYGHTRINSMGYDPYRHMVYYTYSLSGTGGNPNPNERSLRRYDYENNTITVITPDIRTLGIPLFDQGIESGAAAFYDGKLYIGIEGGNSSTRESLIWRIDLDGAYTPQANAVQVWGVDGDTHDWSDFGINDGVLYDFDGDAGNGNQEDFYVQNMLTGVNTNYNPNPNSLVPRQTGVDWQGNIYNMGSASTIAAGTMELYNKTSGVGPSTTITFNGVAETGSWGDAAEAFKPKTDFGDAPASYDPAGSDPATHEIIPTLHLGNAVGIEFAKKTSADASGDGSEEDGIPGTQSIGIGTTNFLLPVKVFNNTGANATLAGWIDRNGNGVYETGEGTTVNVPTGAAVQTINLIWTNINVTLPIGSTTFMRLRVTSATNGMTAANPTGYYNDGEVEDFPINVTLVLPDQTAALDAQKNADKVKLVWKVNHEEGYKSYELQKSNNGSNWSGINERAATGSMTSVNFTFIDVAPIRPVSYYRVKITGNTGAITYTNTRKIDFSVDNSMTVSPNPAKSYAVINLQAAAAGMVQLNLIDFSGRTVYSEHVKVVAGSNDIRLPVVQKLSDGIYKVRVQIDKQILVTSLVVIQ